MTTAAHFDFQTTAQAQQWIAGVVCNPETREGQRESERLLASARIEERDAVECWACGQSFHLDELREDLRCASCDDNDRDAQYFGRE